MIKLFHSILALSLLVVSCTPKNSEKIKWVGCEMGIDSVYVPKDATRGAFSINDTLAMWAGFNSFNYCNYDSINLRIKTFSYEKLHGEWCDISQVKSPFWIHKKAGSDTLYLVQEGKTFLFKIPEHFCGDPKDYWN